MNDWQQSAYMQDNIEDNQDRVTGEVNATMLAEDFLWFGPQSDISDTAIERIAFAMVEMDAGRMSEAKEWIDG